MISREVFVTNDRLGNFYMIGSMGLLSSFGLGMALQFPEKKVYILEGDGSALMSLGSLPLIARDNPVALGRAMDRGQRSYLSIVNAH
jgi:thiamine pyrophosphate-dependent acetolactate synthase large subunit-like protein